MTTPSDKPKFTPGPWKAWGHNVYRAGAGDGANICAMSELRATTEVRHTEPSFNSPHLETIYANAQLCAAAPDLYRPDIREWWQTTDQWSYPPAVREMFDAYCAAIGKVEGRG